MSGKITFDGLYHNSEMQTYLDMRGWRLANAFAVPHTGRRSGGHYFRRPRNIGVKRATVADDGTLRGAKVPPDSYDDISISALRSRNWKRHRNTQWHDRYTV